MCVIIFRFLLVESGGRVNIESGGRVNESGDSVSASDTVVIVVSVILSGIIIVLVIIIVTLIFVVCVYAKSKVKVSLIKQLCCNNY